MTSRKNNFSGNDPEISKSVIALLFVWGEPLSFKKIREVTGADKKDLPRALREANRKLEETGLKIIRQGNFCQLITEPAVFCIVKKIVKNIRESKIGRASLEVLSIVCYRKYSTREEIEMIRGVSSSRAIRSLLIKGLIEEKKIKEVKKYVPSLEFLKLVGIEKIEDLPFFHDFSENEKIKSFLS